MLSMQLASGGEPAWLVLHVVIESSGSVAITELGAVMIEPGFRH
jgi:hypothetical protein